MPVESRACKQTFCRLYNVNNAQDLNSFPMQRMIIKTKRKINK